MVNHRRVFWATVYTLIGVATLVGFIVVVEPVFREWFVASCPPLLWSVGWGAVGIGLGLFNSRDDRSAVARKHLHYITYFLFVWGFASLAAFAAYSEGSYAIAAVIGLATGFSGDRLAGLLGPRGAE